MKKIYLLSLLNLAVYTHLFAGANWTDGVSANTLASKIQGIGITITNPHITFGESSQVGTFTNGINGSNLEIDEGIILTAMSVEESFTTNSSSKTSITHTANKNDVDLLAIDPRANYDTVVFEFDVTLDDNTRLLLVDYQFASEEYNEYVGSQFNDTFGFFISGGDLNQTYNIARVIDNQTYVTVTDIDNYPTVTVNNVNNGSVGEYDDATPEDLSNSQYFIDNTPENNDGTPPLEIEYDGITHTLHATLDNLTPGETYHFKMALADTSDAQWDTGVFINKISALREPSICYDYAYKQNGLYLTEGYDENVGPYVSGDVIANDPNYPVEVAMYFMNTKDSEITASDVRINILDINTSQATYHSESVWVTQPGSVFKTKIDDVDINVSSSYVMDIPVNSFNAFEYFYTYFSVDPKVTTLSLPIIARIDYNLTIPLSATESVTIERSSMIDSDIPICGGGSSEYKPVYGAFNVIENGLYTDDTNYLYNINTQVTGRTGNLSVAAVDMNSTTNPDFHNLKPISTIVAVDMLDLKSFHYTGASCAESTNAITKRVWLIFDDESKTFLNVDGTQFNQVAREQVAFRVAYNYMDDNQTVPYIGKENNGDLTILNWNSTWTGSTCTQDMVTNGQGNDNEIASYCNLTGGSPDDLATCMECIFGSHTKFVCSRDNFAIRPEAFLEMLYDQDETNSSVPLLAISDNGVTTPDTSRIDIAAGYKYRLEVNATNHMNNTASAGYNVHLNSLTGTSSGYKWAPKPGQITTGCNDTSDKMFTIKVKNGRSDLNTTIYQVGDYSLVLNDTVWTTIDSVEQAHHTADPVHFQLGSDCVLNSAVVAKESQFDHLTGCEISSNHTNQDTNVTYMDINVTYNPYQFNITNSVKLGKGNIVPPVATKPFIYMANLTDDENVSVHLNTKVDAVAKNNPSPLSNFVKDCFAKPLNLKIGKTATTNPVLSYSYLVHNLDNNNSIINAQDMNGTIAAGQLTDIPSFATAAAFFQKNLNGSMRLLTNLNYDRDINVTTNPEDITFTTISADDNATIFTADLNTSSYAEGNVSVNQRVLHYYGRTIAPTITVICNTQPCRTGLSATNNNNIQELISYVIYCNGGAATCNNTILPVGSTQVGTISWWANTNHDRNTTGWLPTSTDGDIGAISEVITNSHTTEISRAINTNKYEIEVVLENNGTLPYDAKMQMQSSKWLLNDPVDNTITANEFLIKFVGVGGWSGKYETNTTTKTNFSGSTNRRIMW